MSGPTVVCVMLTRDRPEMARRAVACFRSQSYDPVRRQLIVLDTGDTSWFDNRSDSENEVHIFHTHPRAGTPCNETIGALRNKANSMAGYGEIIAHWDSDDYSSPQRLTEQVVLLEASGADAVGYNEALFWDSTKTDHVQAIAGALDLEGCEERGEAWLYTSPKLDVALGATLLYWRRTWERKRFADVRFGEDTLFQTGMQVKAVSGLGTMDLQRADCGEPRFIAHIHGGNTSSVITPTVRDWKRMPGRDEECRRLMAL